MSDVKVCKDCGLPKPPEEFRQRGRQCKVCHSAYNRRRYEANYHGHTVKAARAAQGVQPTTTTEARKGNYAEVMRERLGFVVGNGMGQVLGCEADNGARGVRCPLMAQCHELERGGSELLLCELSSEEAGVLLVKPSGEPKPDTQNDMELWCAITGKLWL